MITREELLARLQRVKATRRGHEACCPAHEDRKASLSIGTGDDGRLLLKCFAGCSTEAIVAALGYTLADLFPEGELKRAARARTAAPKAKPTIDRVYAYHDESGAHVYDVVRFTPKDFRQRRPNGHGGFLWNLTGIRRVLYRLDRLTTTRPGDVFVVEGEQDVETLEEQRLPATTNPGGAGKWTPDFTAQLQACGVTRAAIVPDSDEPGQHHAEQVAVSLSAVGIEPRIVRLPGLAPHGDVTDFFRAGGTRARLLALTKDTPVWVPTDPLGLETMDALLTSPDEPGDWLVADRLPVGCVALLAAKPKDGKSTLARALAFAVATGTEWLGHHTRRGQVVYLAFEDKRSEVKKHFRQLGAEGHESLRVRFGSPSADLLDQLPGLLGREKIDLLIVDTVQRLLKVKDANDYAEVTAACERLGALARTYSTSIVLVHHAGKGERPGIDGVMGSTAWSAAVDNIFLIKRSNGHRYFSTVQRIGQDLDDTVVRLNPDTGTVALAGSRSLVEVAAVEGQMVAELESSPVPTTRTDLLEAVQARRSLKLHALKNLVRSGRVERTGKGTRSAPFAYLVVPNWFPKNGNQNAGPQRFDTYGDPIQVPVPPYRREPGTTNEKDSKWINVHNDLEDSSTGTQRSSRAREVPAPPDDPADASDSFELPLPDEVTRGGD